MADTPKDLHAAKASHMSVPVDTGIELHLKKSDVGHDCKVGDMYHIDIPAVVTSTDGDSVRFLQRGTLHVHTETPELTKEDMHTMPLDSLKKHIGTVKPGEEYK